jgi:hypothetical protein
MIIIGTEVKVVGMTFVALLIISATAAVSSDYKITWENRGKEKKTVNTRNVILNNCHSDRSSTRKISIEHISRNSVQYKSGNSWSFGLEFSFSGVTIPLGYEIQEEFGFEVGSELKRLETIELPVDPHQHIVYRVSEKEEWVRKRATIKVPSLFGLQRKKKIVDVKYRNRVWLQNEVAEIKFCELKTKTRGGPFMVDMKKVRGDKDFWGTPCTKINVVLKPDRTCLTATIDVELYECSAPGHPSGDRTKMKGRKSIPVCPSVYNTRFLRFLDSDTTRLIQHDSFRKRSRAGLTVKRYGSQNVIRSIKFKGDTDGEDVDANQQVEVLLNEIPILIERR